MDESTRLVQELMMREAVKIVRKFAEVPAN